MKYCTAGPNYRHQEPLQGTAGSRETPNGEKGNQSVEGGLYLVEERPKAKADGLQPGPAST